MSPGVFSSVSVTDARTKHFEGIIRRRDAADASYEVDYAYCKGCGICVEVCPFDALFWSPDYEYSETEMGKMLHDMDRLQDWLQTVPEPLPATTEYPDLLCFRIRRDDDWGLQGEYIVAR